MLLLALLFTSRIQHHLQTLLYEFNSASLPQGAPRHPRLEQTEPSRCQSPSPSQPPLHGLISPTTGFCTCSSPDSPSCASSINQVPAAAMHGNLTPMCRRLDVCMFMYCSQQKYKAGVDHFSLKVRKIDPINVISVTLLI